MHTLAILSLVAISPTQPAPTEDVIPVEYQLPDPNPVAGPVEAISPPRSYRDFVKAGEQKRWNAVKPVAIAATLLNIADAYTTWDCSKSPHCYEKNPLYGSKNPSLGTIVLIKGAQAVGSWFLGKEISKHSAAAGYAWFGVQAVYTGKVVAGNIKILY